MSRLNINMTIAENIINFTDGNPGAIATICELQKAVGDKFATFLITLDCMELYGSKIYMLWNDCCKRDISKVIEVLNCFEKGIIKQKDIDERIKNVGYGKSFDDLINNDESEENKNE